MNGFEMLEKKIRRAQNELDQVVTILRSSQFVVNRNLMADDLEKAQNILEEAINLIPK